MATFIQMLDEVAGDAGEVADEGPIDHVMSDISRLSRHIYVEIDVIPSSPNQPLKTFGP